MKRVILPAEADEKMMLAGMAMAEMMASATQGDAIIAGFDAMLAASPNAGKVTEAELEKARDAIKAAWQGCGDVPFPLYDREATILARSVVASLGLEVEG
jgi:hypothetical protein